MADLTDLDYERLSAYLDDELPAGERAALEEALRAEPALAAALADLRRVQQAVASLPVLRAPRDFRLTADQARPAPKVTALPRRTARWQAAAAVLALLLVGVGGLMLSNQAPADVMPPMVAAAPTPTAEEAEAPLEAAPAVVQPLAAPAAQEGTPAEVMGFAAAAQASPITEMVDDEAASLMTFAAAAQASPQAADEARLLTTDPTPAALIAESAPMAAGDAPALTLADLRDQALALLRILLSAVLGVNAAPGG